MGSKHKVPIAMYRAVRLLVEYGSKVFYWGTKYPVQYTICVHLCSDADCDTRNAASKKRMW